jgi:segregation and condensation protein A
MITVRTERFEGPFDLLFHLIEKNEIDIYDIPISPLTEQYIEYLDSVDGGGDMDTMSGFVLMAATLLEIKSKMLLPAPKKEGEDAEDPRAELVRRLVEYKRYKEVLPEFKAREEEAARFFYKPPDGTLPLKELEKQAYKTGDMLEGITPERLFQIFLDVCGRREMKVDKIRADFGAISRDAYTISRQAEYLASVINERGRVTFASVFGGESSKTEKIVTFLALLELIKSRGVRIVQEEPFGEIIIIRIDTDETLRY